MARIALLLILFSCNVWTADVITPANEWILADRDFVLAGEKGKQFLFYPKGKNGFLGVSVINPMAGQGPLNDFFGDEHRPMTWAEANEACDRYDLYGKKWELPTMKKAMRLTSWELGLAFKKLTQALEHNYPKGGEVSTQYKTVPNQYGYYWVANSLDKLEDKSGLKWAVLPREGTYVMHSENKLLNYFCVARFKREEVLPWLEKRYQ